MEKTKEVLISLNDATISGDIVWNEKNSIFTSDTQKYFTYETEDKSTKFDIKMSINNDLKSLNYSSCLLNIKNEDLIDDSTYIFCDDYVDLKNLVEFIFNTKVKNNLPKKDQKEVLENIIESIGTKSSRRDKKIENILNDETEKEVSIWRRIFKNM